ncbi:MAG: hypothetical protein WD070_03760, partial [Pirellulaceae bacterium]
MSKATDICLQQVACTRQRIQYRTPIKFGGRVVMDAVLFNVTVDVETADGRRGQGFGSMPMGNVWAWPSVTMSGEETLAAMNEFAEQVVAAAGASHITGHPIEITHALSKDHPAITSNIAAKLALQDEMPRLAQLVAASPLEAAIYDAYGKTLGENSYNLLGPEFVNSDLATYLTDEFRGEYLDQYTSRECKPRLPLYHLVGALDPLTDSEIATRLDDGLPETLGEWITADGLTHLKIKLNGDDLSWDVERVAAIERVAQESQAARGCDTWHYSLDFNEKCANVQYVLDFLAKVEENS